MFDFQAGEALGAIGSAEVLDVLREYAKDPQTEVHSNGQSSGYFCPHTCPFTMYYYSSCGEF